MRSMWVKKCEKYMGEKHVGERSKYMGEIGLDGMLAFVLLRFMSGEKSDLILAKSDVILSLT